MVIHMRGNGGIQAVMFDFGGVIAEEGFKKGLSEIARKHGIAEREFIQAAFDATYASGYVLGKATEADFWREVKRSTGLDGPDVSLWDYIYPHFIIRGWIQDLVRSLKGKGLTVGILSDQTDMLDKLDERYDIFRQFDHVFNSFHLGKGKRDISLFDDVAALLRTEPGRLLFIDDHQGHVDRARQKGWQALLYVDRESLETDLERILTQDYSPKAEIYRSSGRP